MNTQKMKLLALATFLSLGLAACDRNDADRMDDLTRVPDGTGLNDNNDRVVTNNPDNTSDSVGNTNTGLDDLGMTAKIKSALIAEPDLSGFSINVDTENSVVTLTGNVDSESRKQRAQQIASNAAGVSQVRNNLRVEAN